MPGHIWRLSDRPVSRRSGTTRSSSDTATTTPTVAEWLIKPEMLGRWEAVVGAVAAAAGAASHRRAGHLALGRGAVAGRMRADDALVLPPGFFEVIRTDGRPLLGAHVRGGNVTTAASDGHGGLVRRGILP
jgi:hypothetical protein